VIQVVPRETMMLPVPGTVPRGVGADPLGVHAEEPREVPTARRGHQDVGLEPWATRGRRRHHEAVGDPDVGQHVARSRWAQPRAGGPVERVRPRDQTPHGHTPGRGAGERAGEGNAPRGVTLWENDGAEPTVSVPETLTVMTTSSGHELAPRVGL